VDESVTEITHISHAFAHSSAFFVQTWMIQRGDLDLLS